MPFDVGFLDRRQASRLELFHDFLNRAAACPVHGNVAGLERGKCLGPDVSGDKGGNANVGVWVRSPDEYRWLERFLSVAVLRELLPETSRLEIDRFELPNLLALNFVVKGLLGDGVAASLRSDPQAKSLGEYLRAKVVPIPASLLHG